MQCAAGEGGVVFAAEIARKYLASRSRKPGHACVSSIETCDNDGMESVQTIEQRKEARVEEIRAGLVRLRDQLADYGRLHRGKFWIYGSAATGRLRFDSDIDILVDFDDARIADALDFAESACGRLRLKPDVQPKTWCSAAFLDRVSATAVVLP